MKVNSFLLALLCLFCLGNKGVLAQFSVCGKLNNSEGKPVEFATVALFSSPDSTLIQAGLSDADGGFIFTNVKGGSYFMTSTFVGFQKFSSQILKINAGLSKIDLGIYRRWQSVSSIA